MVLRSASSEAIQYGFESAFKGGTGVTHLFGKEAKGNSLSWDVSQMPLGQLYTPNVSDFVYGRNVGKVTMEYVLANPWFFTSIFNQPTQTAASPQYTYVWSNDPTVNANIRTVTTMNLIFATIQATDEVRNAKGAITTSVTLKSSVDQTVTVSQQVEWGHEDSISTSFPSVPTDEGFTPMNFTNCTVQLPNSTTLLTVQDWELTIDTGQELFYGMGSADASDVVCQAMAITGKINKAKVDSAMINDVVNRAPIATMTITITNGLSAGNLKSITIALTNVGLSTHNTNGLSPSDIILEEIQFQAQICTVTAINGENITVPMV